MRSRMHRRELLGRLSRGAVGAAGLAGVGAFSAAGADAAGGLSVSVNTLTARRQELPPDVVSHLEPAPTKFDPPINVTTVANAWPTIQYASGDDINNNPWSRAYAEKLGVTVESEWAVPPDQYPERVNLMLASGDLPDFFQANDTQLKQLVENDLLADLTDVYQQSASERVKQAMTDGGPLPIQASTFDGQLMAFPHATVAKEGAPVLWVRSDWIEQLGLPEPTSIQNLLAVAEGFAANDPAGSGGAVGLGMDKDLNYLVGFANGHHAYRALWLDDGSGYLAYSSIQPQMKEALTQLQAMHEAGQIDQEFGVKDGPTTWQDIAAGRIGLFYGSGYSGFVPLENSKRADPNARWTPYPIPSIDAEAARPQVGLGIAGYWVVNKDVQHPEALLAMLDFWVGTFYENTSDAIYEHFVQAGDSENWRMNAIQVVIPFKNLDQSQAITDLIESGSTDTSNLTAEGRSNYENIVSWLDNENIDGWAWDRVFGPTGGMQQVVKTYVAEDRFTQSQFYGAATPAMVSRQSSLTTMELETFTRIIRGESMDEFDQFVDDWKQLGGDDITREVNEWRATQ
ncbi:MAG: extracellular solute-binding protein [Thermomicrobiales bacterium]